MELVALAHLELDLWDDLFFPVRELGPVATGAAPLDPLTVLWDLHPLVDQLSESLDTLPPGETPQPPSTMWTIALDATEDMLYSAGRIHAGCGYGGDVVWWLLTAVADGGDLRGAAAGAAYDALVVTRVLLKALSREMGPPIYQPQNTERGKWLAQLRGNLTVATDGVAELVEAAACETLPPRAGGQVSVLSWPSRWLWLWLWLERRLWPAASKREERYQAARELICCQVDKYFAPRLEVLRTLGGAVAAAVEKHVEAQTRLTTLRTTACELLVGVAPCTEPGMFDRVMGIFGIRLKKAWYGVDWEPPSPPLGALAPEFNDAWYGEFELVLSGSEEGHSLRESQEDTNYTDWWRRKKTVGCMRTKYYFPDPDTIRGDVSAAWQPLIEKRLRFCERWQERKERYRGWNYWAETWASLRDDAEGKEDAL